MKIERQTSLGDLLHDLWRDNLQGFLRDSEEIDHPKSKIDEKSEPLALSNDLMEPGPTAKPDIGQKVELTNLAVDEPNGEQVVAQAERPMAEPTLGRDDEEPALVENAKADPQAFGVLYERYLDRIYTYIYRRVGNTQDTEDLTARTFYKALNKLNSYEDRGYPFSAWLFRIAHNLVANWHRDCGRRRFSPIDRLWSYSQETDTLDQKVEREEKHTALWDAINRLPQERRDLLIYKFNNCLSNVEIGQIMNKSESAIKSLYFRTLAALRQDLEAAEL